MSHLGSEQNGAADLLVVEAPVSGVLTLNDLHPCGIKAGSGFLNNALYEIHTPTSQKAKMPIQNLRTEEAEGNNGGWRAGEPLTQPRSTR